MSDEEELLYEELEEPGVYNIIGNEPPMGGGIKEYLVVVKHRYLGAPQVGTFSVCMKEHGPPDIYYVDYTSSLNYKDRKFTKCPNLKFTGLIVVDTPQNSAPKE